MKVRRRGEEVALNKVSDTVNWVDILGQGIFFQKIYEVTVEIYESLALDKEGIKEIVGWRDGEEGLDTKDDLQVFI